MDLSVLNSVGIVLVAVYATYIWKSLKNSIPETSTVTEVESYTLPAASANTLGGIKVGEGLTISEDGTLSVTVTQVETGESYTLPIASTKVLGGIKIGNGLTISEDGTVSATGMDVLVLEDKPTVDDLEQGQVALVVES